MQVQVLCIFFIFSFFRNNEEIFISFGFKQKSVKHLDYIDIHRYSPVFLAFRSHQLRILITKPCDFQVL